MTDITQDINLFIGRGTKHSRIQTIFFTRMTNTYPVDCTKSTRTNDCSTSEFWLFDESQHRHVRLSITRSQRLRRTQKTTYSLYSQMNHCISTYVTVVCCIARDSPMYSVNTSQYNSIFNIRTTTELAPETTLHKLCTYTLLQQKSYARPLWMYCVTYNSL